MDIVNVIIGLLILFSNTAYSSVIYDTIQIGYQSPSSIPGGYRDVGAELDSDYASGSTAYSTTGFDDELGTLTGASVSFSSLRSSEYVAARSESFLNQSYPYGDPTGVHALYEISASIDIVSTSGASFNAYNFTEIIDRNCTSKRMWYATSDGVMIDRFFYCSSREGGYLTNYIFDDLNLFDLGFTTDDLINQVIDVTYNYSMSVNPIWCEENSSCSYAGYMYAPSDITLRYEYNPAPPQPLDSDGDGNPNETDECPYDPQNNCNPVQSVPEPTTLALLGFGLLGLGFGRRKNS